MKVCIIWQGYDPDDVRIAKFAAAVTAAGGSATVIHRGRPGASPGPARPWRCVPVEGGRVRTVPVPCNPTWTRAIARVLAAEPFDLVVVRDIPLFACAWLAAPRGMPLVVDMAEHYPEAMRSWRQYADNPVLRPLVYTLRIPDRVEAFAVRRSAAIAVVCEEMRGRLQQDFAFPAERIGLVMNTPRAATISGVPRHWRPADAREIVFGYHGILCEDRQLETVVLGFDRAAQRDARLRLLLCGDGESAAALRALAATLPSAGRIEFTGRYRADEQPALYARTHFGIVSLRDTPFTRHTLGNKFFDYPASGMPFLYPALPPLSTIARRIGSGLPFAAGDPASVAEAMLDATAVDYPALSARGVDAIRAEFTWERDEARLIELLRRSIASR